MTADTATLPLDYIVVIPAYNAAGTLKRALESALAQTLPPKSIVVVDDGSPDGEELAAIVAATPGPIRLVRQANAGPAAARNRGVAEVGSTWIAFLDADDSWMPDKMERQLALADDGKIGLLYGMTSASTRPPPEFIDFDTLWIRNRIGTSMVVVRRAAYEGVAGFDEDRSLIGAEDYNLWLRMAAAGWKLRGCPIVFGHYTPAIGSLSRQLERAARGEIRSAQKIGELLGLDPARVEDKVLDIEIAFGRHMLNNRDLKAARAWLSPVVRRHPTPTVVAMWMSTFLPPSLLRLRSKVNARVRGR
jgi:glycosyltransferase involved in cell wall biosynthesis